MFLVLFWGCKEPGLMEAVTAALGDEVRVAAEPGLRLSTDLAGVVAETCAVEVLNGYTWSGVTASGLGMVHPDNFMEEQSGAIELEFLDVGPGDQSGTLTLSAESARASWSTHWEDNTGTLLLEGTLVVERCDADAVRISGGISWHDPLHEVSISIGDTEGFIGFETDGTGVPISGQASWNGGDTDLEATLLLDSAALGLELSQGTGRWTGLAEGKGWEHATAIAFP